MICNQPLGTSDARPLHVALPQVVPNLRSSHCCVRSHRTRHALQGLNMLGDRGGVISSSHAGCWGEEPPPGLDLPPAPQSSVFRRPATAAGFVPPRHIRTADINGSASRARQWDGGSAAAEGRHGDNVPTRGRHTNEGYQDVPFAYAPPGEQDRQAEQRLRSDAFKPGLLWQPAQPGASVHPSERGEERGSMQWLPGQPVTGRSMPKATDLPGASSFDAAAEDDRSHRRQKKKQRHKERKRDKREKRERRSTRSPQRDALQSDHEAQVSEP